LRFLHLPPSLSLSCRFLLLPSFQQQQQQQQQPQQHHQKQHHHQQQQQQQQHQQFAMDATLINNNTINNIYKNTDIKVCFCFFLLLIFSYSRTEKDTIINIIFFFTLIVVTGFLNCNSNTLSLAQLQGKLDFHEFIPGKPFFQSIEDHINADETGVFVDGGNLQLGSPARSSPHSQGSDNGERFSRKVFVGGLPPDIDEDEITASFRRYGPLIVDWPHKAESKSYFPPKGYAFLLFQDESSVQNLIENCIIEDDKLYICVSSPTIKNKPVQIRPWRLSDADFVLDASMPLDPRKTVFVGGVPRPLKALELAMIMDRLYGGVCYAGIDTDPELKYPKGAGRVAFSNQQSYIAAISARFVQLQHGDIDKRVEVKPYVLDDQMCDECQGQRCSGKFAPFFCANVTCLQYYCEHCWATIHSRPGREYHKPLVKEGADRPRAVPFRWC
ncbi:unnamed protein product, partial [Diamesa serratosioi]